MIKKPKKDKMDYSDVLLDMALEKNQLYGFIGGMGVYAIERSSYSGGEKRHSPETAMDILYNRYKTTKDDKLVTEIDKALAFLMTTKADAFVYALRAIEYHMRAEESGLAPFRLDCKKYLITARENIKNNYELFKQGDLIRDIENANQVVERHGHSIL